MLEDSLKRHLEILKKRARRLASARKGLIEGGKGKGELGEGYSLDPAGAPVELHKALPGSEAKMDEGECYLVKSRFEADGRSPLNPTGLPPSLESVFGSNRVGISGRYVFLDIETAGLAPNTYLFLCGLMYPEASGYRIEQYLARDYSEEKALLAAVTAGISGCTYAVTYNGASFDIPFLRTRCAVHRRTFPDDLIVLDLLYATRRCFSSILPDCRLETVEAHLGGGRRVGDIPGREIPDTYRRFVSTGDARIVVPIVEHNRRDLVAMERIARYLADRCTESPSWS